MKGKSSYVCLGEYPMEYPSRVLGYLHKGKVGGSFGGTGKCPKMYTWDRAKILHRKHKGIFGHVLCYLGLVSSTWSCLILLLMSFPYYVVFTLKYVLNRISYSLEMVKLLLFLIHQKTLKNSLHGWLYCCSSPKHCLFS